MFPLLLGLGLLILFGANAQKKTVLHPPPVPTPTPKPVPTNPVPTPVATLPVGTQQYSDDEALSFLRHFKGKVIDQSTMAQSGPASLFEIVDPSATTSGIDALSSIRTQNMQNGEPLLLNAPRTTYAFTDPATAALMAMPGGDWTVLLAPGQFDRIAMAAGITTTAPTPGA